MKKSTDVISRLIKCDLRYEREFQKYLLQLSEKENREIKKKENMLGKKKIEDMEK